jgi:DNA (cytosine-5)-methyltransferase 1
MNSKCVDINAIKSCGQDRLVRHLDLFSGIGGFATAAKRVGWKTIGFSEVEKYAIRVLGNNWPNVPNYGDIREMRGVPCDVLTGGFPCQPYSKAGKQLGKHDERHLWPEMLRVIGESKPTWIIGENVPNLIKMGLDEVQADLEVEGYSSQAFSIPACAVGAPHKRERLWVVAYADSGRWNASGETFSMDGIQGDEAYLPSSIKTSGGVSRWQGGEAELRIPRVADGIRDGGDRNKALGNAIVPDIAYELMKMVDCFLPSDYSGLKH